MPADPTPPLTLADVALIRALLGKVTRAQAGIEGDRDQRERVLLDALTWPMNKGGRQLETLCDAAEIALRLRTIHRDSWTWNRDLPLADAIEAAEREQREARKT